MLELPSGSSPPSKRFTFFGEPNIMDLVYLRRMDINHEETWFSELPVFCAAASGG